MVVLSLLQLCSLCQPLSMHKATIQRHKLITIIDSDRQFPNLHGRYWIQKQDGDEAYPRMGVLPIKEYLKYLKKRRNKLDGEGTALCRSMSKLTSHYQVLHAFNRINAFYCLVNNLSIEIM